MNEIIADGASLDALCSRVRAAERVALDTEFHNERTYSARLMVVQLAFADGVALVDPLALPDLRPLVEALAETTVVGHALTSDLRIFAERFGALPRTAFDTQIAAAFAGFGLSISLLDLVQSLTGTRLRKSQTVSDWSTRPLSAPQIEYLVDDVAYLFRLQEALVERLEREGRLAWALDEMAPLCALTSYQSDPERLYLRLPGAARMGRRELGLLRAVAQLRDALARERDLPAKFIFPDDVVGGVVALRPGTVGDLAQLRRLEAGARKAYGAAIVAAVAEALALPESELPAKPQRSIPQHREAIVALLGVLVNATAAEHGLPGALLASRASLERVARDLPTDAASLAASLEANAWRVDLLAEPLLALLRGECALAITGPADAPRVVARSLDPVQE